MHMILLTVVQNVARIVFPEDEILENKFPQNLDSSSTNYGTSPLRKCCKKGEVLDRWHKCKRRKHAVKEFRKEVNSISEVLERNTFVRNIFGCPKRMVNEYVPLTIFSNGSILIEMDDTNAALSSYHCLDITEVEPNSFDGLHVVMCSMEGMRDREGYISKCCNNDEVLDEVFEKCVTSTL